MAVRKVAAKRQANYAIPMWEQQAVVPYFFTILSKSNFDRNQNDTIWYDVDSGYVATARDYEFRTRTADIQFDDIFQNLGRFPVRLNQHITSATELTLEHLTLDDINFAREVLGPQVDAVVKRVENKALAFLDTVSAKHTLDATDGLTLDEDPLVVVAEARRLMDSEKVAPRAGRVMVVGSDVATAWITSDRLSRYDSTGETGTPALREAVIGRIAGTTVVEHSGIAPNKAYYMHSSGLLLGSAAPVVPQGAVTGSSAVGKSGLDITWIQDYFGNRAVDRSFVHTFLGFGEVRDERRPDGGWIVEEGELTDEELAVYRNPDGSTVTPAAVGTRKNVRIIPLTFEEGGSLLTPPPATP